MFKVRRTFLKKRLPKSGETEPGRSTGLLPGFTFVEILILCAVIGLGAAMAVPYIRETVDFYDAEAALQLTAAQLRRGSQRAVDLRRRTRVSFIAPNRIDVHQFEEGAWIQVNSTLLPRGFEFRVEEGLPAAPDETPDGLGASAAVDFAGAQEIYFLPDSTAVNAGGQITSGIVYMARPGKVLTARAVTVSGTTARIRMWRFLEGNWQ